MRMKSTEEAIGYDVDGDLRRMRHAAVSRRELLGNLAIIAAALATPSVRSLSAVTDGTISSLASRVAAVLGFKETFDFGHVGGEAAVTALLSDILNLTVSQQSSMFLSDAQLRERISARTALDYHRNDMINLAGWWISTTEARCLKLIGAIETSALESVSK
jgi:hypothetical protein